MPNKDRSDLSQERWKLLRQFHALIDKPMIALAFVWLGLLIIEFTMGLTRPLEILTYAIWVLFVLDFMIEVAIAPHKVDYLRHNWLSVISLVLPALRVLRVFRALRLLRAARAARSVRLLRLLTSLNRGMRALSNTFGRHGVGYVIVLTTVVTFAGAAGMALFESPDALRETGDLETLQKSVGLNSYGDALWWTAMIMTTMGSEYWPKTVEGRILGWLLSLYAFAIFGYITATIASHFIGVDAVARQEQSMATEAGLAEMAALREEVTGLRSQVAALTRYFETGAVAHPRYSKEEHNQNP